MSMWGEWSECDPSCLNPNRRKDEPRTNRWRNRHIIQHPLRGGYPCPTTMKENSDCELCKKDETSKEEESGARRCVHYCAGKFHLIK